MSLSLKRLESTALRELSILLSRNTKNKNLNNVTITDVKITNDLSFMTVYYTFYQGKEENYQEAFENAKSYIRMELAKRIKARKMPELIFKRDSSLDYGNHINDLLKSIHEHDKEIQENIEKQGLKEED